LIDLAYLKIILTLKTAAKHKIKMTIHNISSGFLLQSTLHDGSPGFLSQPTDCGLVVQDGSSGFVVQSTSGVGHIGLHDASSGFALQSVGPVILLHSASLGFVLQSGGPVAHFLLYTQGRRIFFTRCWRRWWRRRSRVYRGCNGLSSLIFVFSCC
jgi:hypothetical protein